MIRRLIPILWIAAGVALIVVVLALARSTTTAPVSHRVPGEGRMQPFYGVEPGRSGR
jgi:peptidoglycan/LPS O-acetylase OafA/YrhL